MAIRFDYGELKKPARTPDGMLVCEATFARDGILEYRQPDGKIRREFRPPEENEKALTDFGLAPVTIEHPPVLLTEDNADDYRKGVSLQNIRYGKGGFVRGEIILMDSQAIDYALRQDGAEISAGYTCDIEDVPGSWLGQRYDCVQRNIRVNHLALTKRGRAGPDVRLHLDSADQDVAVQVVSSHTKKRMATIRIDSVDYEIPETIAPVLGAKISRLDAVEAELDQAKERVTELESELEDAENDRDRERGRADAQDICLTNAEIILEGLGYRRDAAGDYVRVDMKGKKKPDMEMEDEEMGMEEEDMEDMPKKDMYMKGKKKMDKSKCDSVDDVRLDAKALMVAWKEADQLVADLSNEHFDSAETPADVRRLVVAKLRPQLAEKLDSMSDGAIDGIYDFLKEELGSRKDSAVEERADARPSYSQELRSVIGAANAIPTSNAEQARSQEVGSNWQKPLSLSR